MRKFLTLVPVGCDNARGAGSLEAQMSRNAPCLLRSRFRDKIVTLGHAFGAGSTQGAAQAPPPVQGPPWMSDRSGLGLTQGLHHLPPLGQAQFLT
jgi:hypothetical protein